ncbi:hypothetical protein BO99DRAFT_437734 [Aspergillus violaceofuscus CBS 115571]|uniref:Uncharacterized protein n=1 Tax=Aspergillus violaceofuscus (strain CBS 115571) TaxID=1450538 RepID=A0A2V5HQ48_ASPV1|nr:hypothetical protein BO99DRAFT_437734 [Aspergillus violaceofuscus CBS 115571]
MSDSHASKRSRTDPDGNVLVRSVEPDYRNINGTASPNRSAGRSQLPASDPRPRSCSPMPDLDSELIAKKFEIVHPRLHDLLLAKCGQLTDEQMRSDGLCILVGIGRMLVSQDELPGDILHDPTQAVAITIRRAMLIILTGVYVFPVEYLESSWEKLYEEVKELNS